MRNPNPRMAVAPMEPNACLVIPDPTTGQITVYASTQMPHMLRDVIAAHIRRFAATL